MMETKKRQLVVSDIVLIGEIGGNVSRQFKVQKIY